MKKILYLSALLIALISNNTYAEDSKYIASISNLGCSVVSYLPGSCNIGEYKSAGMLSSSCSLAEPGNYACGWNQTKCDPGTYQDLSGQSECKQASPGFYTSIYGATNKTSASAGYYVPGTGSSVQYPCPLGTYMTNTGAIICEKTQPGNYVDSLGSINYKFCSNKPTNSSYVGIGGTTINFTTGSWETTGYGVPTSECPYNCNVGYAKSGTGCFAIMSGSSDAITSEQQLSQQKIDFYNLKLEIDDIYSQIKVNKTYFENSLNEIYNNNIKILHFFSGSLVSNSTGITLKSNFNNYYSTYSGALLIMYTDLNDAFTQYKQINGLNYSDTGSLVNIKNSISSKKTNISSKISELNGIFNNAKSDYNKFLNEVKQLSVSNIDLVSQQINSVDLINRQNVFTKDAERLDNVLASVIYTDFKNSGFLKDGKGKLKTFSEIENNLDQFISDNYLKILNGLSDYNGNFSQSRKNFVLNKIDLILSEDYQNLESANLGTLIKDSNVSSGIQQNFLDKISQKNIITKDSAEYIHPKIKDIIDILGKGTVSDISGAISEANSGYSNIKSYLTNSSKSFGREINSRSDLVDFINSNTDINTTIIYPLQKLLNSKNNISYFAGSNISTGNTLAGTINKFKISEVSSTELDNYENQFSKKDVLFRIDEIINSLFTEYNTLNLLQDDLERLGYIKGCEPGQSSLVGGYEYAIDSNGNYTIPCSKRKFNEYIDNKKREILSSLLKSYDEYKTRSNELLRTLTLSSIQDNNIIINNNGEISCKPGSVLMGKGCINLKSVKIGGYGYGSDVGVLSLDPFQCNDKSTTELINQCREEKDAFRIVDENGKIKLRGYVYSTEYGPIKFSNLDVGGALDAAIDTVLIEGN